MKFFRTFFLLVSISAVIAGSFFFVSYLLDEEMRLVVDKRIGSLDANYDSGFVSSIQWGSTHGSKYNLSTYGDDLYTLLVNTPRAERILQEFMDSPDSIRRTWASLIVAENANSMPKKCVSTLWEVIEKGGSPRASAIAYYYLRDFARIKTPRTDPNADKLSPPSEEELAELEKYFPKK